MRLLTAVTFSLAAAACGGGGNNPPPVIIDSPPIDQPPAATCPVCGPDSPCTVGGAQQMDLGGLVLNAGAGPDGMQGTADDLPLGPNACGQGGTGNCDFFDVPTAGANNGKKTFFLLAGTPDELNTAGGGTQNLLGVELVATNGAFVAGTTNFSTAPDAVTSSLIFATPMGTTAYSAIAYVVNVSGTTINNVYTSTSGSITTTKIDTNGDTPNTDIAGTVASTNLAETDGAALIPGGCTTTLQGLSFTLKQGQPAFAKPEAPGGQPGMTRARAEAIYNNLKAFHKN